MLQRNAAGFWPRHNAKAAAWKLLEEAGLISQPPDSPGIWRERFRGRLIFPIHDERGRTLGFGGRILPEIERTLAAVGKQVAKYLNSPETLVFHKRTLVYASDLARNAGREAGWVAVVEGYTDVIAAHQVGLANVVGTLGTAFGEDHLRALKRLADRVILVFDGDDAGQSAADRALEFFLASDLDLRVLTLPANLDPCDFLLKKGPMRFALWPNGPWNPWTIYSTRAVGRFDLSSVDGLAAGRRVGGGHLEPRSRVSSTWTSSSSKAKVLDKLSHRLRVPLDTLNGLLRQLQRSAAGQRRNGARMLGRPRVRQALFQHRAPSADPVQVQQAAIRASDLDSDRSRVYPDPLERADRVHTLDPAHRRLHFAGRPAAGDPPGLLRSASGGQTPSYENLMVRLDDPAIRSLVVGLAGPNRR